MARSSEATRADVFVFAESAFRAESVFSGVLGVVGVVLGSWKGDGLDVFLLAAFPAIISSGPTRRPLSSEYFSEGPDWLALFEAID